MITSKYLHYCIFLLFSVTSINAKTFSGRVVDSETGTGLVNVSIKIDNSVLLATTDQNGQFSFSSELSSRAGGFQRGNREQLKWCGKNHLLDLKSVHGLTSVSLYNLKGVRLFYKEVTPGLNLLKLPALPDNLYLLQIGKNDGEYYTVKWADLDYNAVFKLGKSNNGVKLSNRQAETASLLVFEKKEYQTRKIEVHNESTYVSMMVKLKPEIGSYIFNEDTVRTYRLYFTEKNLAQLLDFSLLVPYSYTVNSDFVQARLVLDGRTMDSIGVRFRGDQSLWDCVSNGERKKGVTYPQFGFGNSDICAKFSMKFDFNKYDKDSRLYGLKALNFRSMSADPTKMHEKLGFSLFEDMGITSPRTAYARLYVNDSLWGLFGVTEEIDGRFTKSHYPESGNGNLYKEIWPTDRLTDEAIRDGLVTNSDPEDNPDINDFKALRDIVISSETDSVNFMLRIGSMVDVPYLVRYIVVDRGIMNFDGIMILYGSSMRHNYFWYHDEESGLLRLIPWDLDKIFLYPEPNFWTNNEPNGFNIVPNWNVVNSTYTTYNCQFDPGSQGGTYPVSSIDKDTFLRLVRNTTWSDFKKQGQAFLDTVFTNQKIDARLERWRKLIADAVGEDPTIDSTEWTVMVDSLSNTIPLMRKNLKMMIDTLIVK